MHLSEEQVQWHQVIGDENSTAACSRHKAYVHSYQRRAICSGTGAQEGVKSPLLPDPGTAVHMCSTDFSATSAVALDPSG